MSVAEVKFVMRSMALSIVTGIFAIGCGSGSSDADGNQAGTQTEGADGGQAEPETAGSSPSDFDGLWRTDCVAQTVFGVPEDSQPEGYLSRTLTLDSATKTYSTTTQMYTDSQCTVEDPNNAAITVSGEILFDGTVTTSSGLEASVVRYFNNGTSPDLIGLLYRDGDTLYRELRQSTLIENEVPSELSLSVAWRLVN